MGKATLLLINIKIFYWIPYNCFLQEKIVLYKVMLHSYYCFDQKLLIKYCSGN